MATTSSSFGILLRDLREQAGLTQSALAERAGIGATTVEALEQGVSRHARPSTATALAEAPRLEGQRQTDFVLAARGRAPEAAHAGPAHPSRARATARSPLLGKSAVLAQLVKARGYIHHFNIRALGINHTDAFLTNVCAQLIATFRLDYRAVSPRQSHDGAFLDHLLHEIADTLPAGDQVVIAVDALDAVVRRGYIGGTYLLFLPMRLPAGVYVIATVRHDPLSLRADCGVQSYPIAHGSVDNRADLRRYVERSLAQPGIQTYLAARGVDATAFAGEMVDRSDGNFVYLSRCCRASRTAPIGTAHWWTRRRVCVATTRTSGGAYGNATTMPGSHTSSRSSASSRRRRSRSPPSRSWTAPVGVSRWP